MIKALYVRWIAILVLLFVTSNIAFSSTSYLKKEQQAWTEESDINDFDSEEDALKDSEIDLDLVYFFETSNTYYCNFSFELSEKTIQRFSCSKKTRKSKTPFFILYCQIKISC